MARPRKMTTEQMVEVVNSYYMQNDGNPTLLKCSIIARYASQLGYDAEGYDFRRNEKVRAYIDQLRENSAAPEKDIPLTYKALDIDELLRCNGGNAQLAKALADLDSYWKRVSGFASMTAEENRKLMAAKHEYELSLKEAAASQERIHTKNEEISLQNNKLVLENRYLRKMLRTYLYPAVADEILVRENALKESSTQVTQTAVRDLTEFGVPQSLQKSTACDTALLADEERLLEKMWEACDE